MSTPTNRQAIDVSVVLCTRNRAVELDRTLAAFGRISTEAQWQLVLVDNGSTDATAQVIEGWAAQGSLPLVPVFEPRKGLARARNAGLRRAEGDIIAFTDDDCYPSPDFVDAWIAVFQDPTLGFAGGRIELFDSTDIPVTIRTETAPEDFAPYHYIHPGMIFGASMAFRRSAILRLGIFDERLGAGTRIPGGEDCEYVQRASDCGLKGGYRPQPLVWHHHGRKSQDHLPLLRGYAIGTGGHYACLFMRRPIPACRNFAQLVRSHGSANLWLRNCYWALRKPWGRKAALYMAWGILLFVVETVGQKIPRISSAHNSQEGPGGSRKLKEHPTR